MSELAEKLEASGEYTSVVARPKARVPIVALHDASSGLKSDICMCNRLALLNSRLLRCYMEIDPRAPALCFAVRQQGRSARLDGATAGRHGLVRLHLKAWGRSTHS